MKSLVIIPTFNEAENVENIIQAVLKQAENLDVLIVDDNSPDGTSQIVENLIKADSRIKLIKRKGKLGLGTAYIRGFKFALKRDYDFIFEMDADFSHNPDEIPNMLEAIKENDLVIGSRYIKGINVVNWPLRRLILSYMASFYVRFITRMKIADPTGGFKCFRREVLEAIDLDKIHSNGYSFQVEMNFRTWLKKFRIKEIPIIFRDRRVGQSKMSKAIVREAIYMVWKLKILSLLGKL